MYQNSTMLTIRLFCTESSSKSVMLASVAHLKISNIKNKHYLPLAVKKYTASQLAVKITIETNST